MSIKRTGYKTYTKEFKLEAIRLMSLSDKPSAEIAAELGIRRNILYKWKEQLESSDYQDTHDNKQPKKVFLRFITNRRKAVI
jgi:transposase